MMMDWEEYRKQLIATIQQIGQASPDIVRGYRTIADGAAKIGKLDPKVRELISLAVAVMVRRRDGATQEDLIEAPSPMQARHWYTRHARLTPLRHGRALPAQ